MVRSRGPSRWDGGGPRDGGPGLDKLKFLAAGAAIVVSMQLGYIFFKRRFLRERDGGGASSGDGSERRASLSEPAGLPPGAIHPRTLSPLHHLDLAKLKSRSAQSTNNNRNVETQGESAIFQIVLTGGPSGGKSSTMSRLDKILREDHGFDVYLCPEVPTLLLNGGARYPGLDGGDELVAFEVSLVELQLQMELSFYQIAASTGRPSVIVYDRGLLDFAAYTPIEKWGLIMNHNQWICDGILNCATKYDLVLHMESAAVGAERFFHGREGGLATTEELEEARILDKKILTCWRGHPHHRVIDNVTDFEGKLTRATRHVQELVLNHRLL